MTGLSDEPCRLIHEAFVMYIITRETIYYINLRHAYLLAPFNAAKLSSRTVLFTQVPVEYLSVEKLQQLFGGSFKRCWLTTDCTELVEEVELQEKNALKLEGAEIKLSKNAIGRKLKAEKKDKKNKKPTAPTQDVEANSASQWEDKKDRPTHRLGKIPFIGKKVDTIEWTRSELTTSVPKIEKAQATHLKSEGTLLPFCIRGVLYATSCGGCIPTDVAQESAQNESSSYLTGPG